MNGKMAGASPAPTIASLVGGGVCDPCGRTHISTQNFVGATLAVALDLWDFGFAPRKGQNIPTQWQRIGIKNRNDKRLRVEGGMGKNTFN